MSTRQTFSNATRLFFGPVAYAGAYEGKRGAPMDPLKTLVITPATIVTDGLIKAATGAEIPDAAETVTYTYPASNVSPTDGTLYPGVLDVARNIITTVTHGSSIVAMTILITGKDIYGRVMSELQTITATGTTKTVTGTKAFKEITSIALTAAADASANTVNIGTGKAFGLPVKVTESMLFSARFNNAIDAGTFVPAVATTATTTTGDVRGTFTPAGTPDAAKVLGLVMQIADPTTAVGTYGVPQA